MRIKTICRVTLLSAALLSSQMILSSAGAEEKLLVISGGFDSYSWWQLTDENLTPLEDGDLVMVLWTGPDGTIDPPVSIRGNQNNGQPTGDDEIIFINHQPYGYIEYAGFYLTANSWDVGDLDSLGHQRHPTPGEKIYVRVFNSDDLVTSTHYGESNLYEVVGLPGEFFWAQMPNDPIGPTTNTPIWGRSFKIIGGIDPVTGASYPLKDPYRNLEDGDVVQLIYTGADAMCDPPDVVTRMPGGDDQLIEEWAIGEGMYPCINTSVFRRFTASFDDPGHGLPAEDQLVFVRVFNESNILQANCYGDSELYGVMYVIGESLSVFTDDAVDCDVCRGLPDIQISGGWKPDDSNPYPMIDADGLRLNDGDLVQLIWAGPDTLVDVLDSMAGWPTGDDSLLTTWSIGEGVATEGSGCFIRFVSTWSEHGWFGYPAEGDFIYLRMFNDPFCTGATYYGETGTHVVTHEHGEKFYAFADSAVDADRPNPCYTTSVEERVRSTTTRPVECRLFQNRPNPFNETTEISFATPDDGTVSLKIYDIRGALVGTLVNARKEAGIYSVRWKAGDYASGVYFCRLQQGEFGRTIKMVLLR